MTKRNDAEPPSGHTSTEPPPPATALAGIRVLDVTQVMSGPFCTMILADLGADVIKIENPMGGDQTRRSMGVPGRGTDTLGFLALNRNKRSVCLDLKTPAGLAHMLELIETADVLIENWRPGVAKRLGLGYEQVRERNPRLVYASISGFGQDGPYASRPGYDLIAQAMSGVMSVTGEDGGRPVKSGLPIADLGAGLFSAVGILAAVYARTHTGRGQHFETSLFEAALSLAVWESTEYFRTGLTPGPLGTAHRMLAPYQSLRTQDGYLVVAAGNERFWNQLCEMLGVEHLLTDDRFIDNRSRIENRHALEAELEKALATDTTTSWVDRLLAVGIPAGPIADYREVLDHDPHVRARGIVKVLDHPVEGPTKVLGSPLRLSDTPVQIRKPAPLLGEDTAAVLQELPSMRAIPTEPLSPNQPVDATAVGQP